MAFHGKFYASALSLKEPRVATLRLSVSYTLIHSEIEQSRRNDGYSVITMCDFDGVEKNNGGGGVHFLWSGTWRRVMPASNPNRGASASLMDQDRVLVAEAYLLGIIESADVAQGAVSWH